VDKKIPSLLSNSRQNLPTAAAMPQQSAVFLAQPGAQVLIEVAEQPGPQFGWIKPSVVLNPTPQDWVQAPGDLFQRQKHPPSQMHSPDPLSHALERLRTHRWEEAPVDASRPEALDLPIAVSSHAWSEGEAKKRELDLIELTPAAAVLAIDHLGLLWVQL
jgi:hypothetical protein